MSIRLEVLSKELMERLDALEKKFERHIIPINQSTITIKSDEILVPKRYSC